MCTDARQTARAVSFTAERQAEPLEEEEVGAPGPGEVQVRAIASLDTPSVVLEY